MTCDRHEEVTERLDKYGERIRKLEVNDATMGAKIENLTDSIKDLVWWLKTFIVGLFGVATTFVIWYIQKG